MSEIANLTSSINTRIAATLSTFSAMAYVIEHEKNNFKGNQNKYGVLAGAIDEVDGCLGTVTIDQVFKIKLTDSYAPSQTGDSDKISAGNTLMEKQELIYKDLVNTKAGLSGTVINVRGMSIDENIYIEKSNVIISEMNVTITYRQEL